MASEGDSNARDAELAARAVDGDVRALDELIDLHESRVLRVLRLMGVPAQEREDVAQEVFLRVFRHLRGFRRNRSFQSWLYKICVNAAYDHRGRVGRRAEEPMADGFEGPAAPLTRGGESPEAHHLRITLERALVDLTDRERAVFILRNFEGLETREIARTLGITSITVRRHLSRAESRLRERLEADAGVPLVEERRKKFGGD